MLSIKKAKEQMRQAFTDGDSIKFIESLKALYKASLNRGKNDN